MNSMKLSEIRDLLEGADDRWLFSRADEVRNRTFGHNVYLRGVVEFSNYCVKNCLYCGLRQASSAIRRYRLDKDEILEAASLLPELGIGTLVLQSGDDYRYGKELVGEIIHAIKNRYDVAVTLSLGDRRKDEYRYWKDCGADRYLLKIETSSEVLYETLRPGHLLEHRLVTLAILRNLGYEIGSGIIVGLPGTDTQLLAQDIFALARLELDMIAVGPFVPHPDTPLGKEPAGDLLTSYRAIAVLRMMNPQANIPATSALTALSDDGKAAALQGGANVVMPSITPKAVRDCYNIYPGKNAHFQEARAEIEAAKLMICGCQLIPSPAKGPSARHIL